MDRVHNVRGGAEGALSPPSFRQTPRHAGSAMITVGTPVIRFAGGLRPNRKRPRLVPVLECANRRNSSACSGRCIVPGGRVLVFHPLLGTAGAQHLSVD